MILKGNLGRLTINLLKKSSVFNRHFTVVRLFDTFKIFQSIPKEKLRQTEITSSNFLKFRFDVYDAFHILKEHAAQIEKLDEDNKCLIIKAWDSERMNRLIKRFSLPLTDQTFSELKRLLSVKVFSEKLGDNYIYFVSVWVQHEIKKVADSDRRYSEGTLKYSMVAEKDKKERRLKSKFSLTKQEAIEFSSNISYWTD
jgi:hypothetical protein